MFHYIRFELKHAWIQLIWYMEKNIIHVALPHPGVPKLCEIRRAS